MGKCKLACVLGFLVGVFVLIPSTAAWSYERSPPRAISESRYTRAHSLGDSYAFDPRDGWQEVNISNLAYKYPQTHASPAPLSSRSPKKSIGSSLTGVVDKVWKGLKGIGKAQPAIITWYTGHDLKNPSCWAQSSWAPSDESFACALTMKGWKDRPKCFRFLELCNTPKKCVFVRVVDSCAGCAAGTRHVDLTKAAFRQLAEWDVGELKVQFRQATEPDTWHEKLWGPKVKK